MRSNFLTTKKKNELQSNFFNSNYDIVTNFLNDIIEILRPDIWDGQKIVQPKIDIYETDNEYKLEVELPGVTENNISLKISDNILSIEAKKESIMEDKKEKYYIKERYYDAFSRAINLPYNINEEKISAKFKDGILRVVLPKKEASKSREIKINKVN